MKAILILDEMPGACAECPLCVHAKFDYYFDEHICTANGQEILDERYVHHMCPLKEMPEKRILPSWQVNNTNYGEEPWFSDGWNACIEEIDK